MASGETERTPLLLSERGAPLSEPEARHVAMLGNDGGRDEEEGATTDETTTTVEEEGTHVSVASIVLVLMIGVVMSNADSSFLMATHTVISSEFGALRDSSWLLTSFTLASAVTQPLYGKLSDIYGRKQCLVVAYLLFAVGCALVGIGTSMPQLILGRVISGLGSSGMTALVSILVTDLLPLRSVAAWRSYVNIVATTARSIGGPLGGWLADTVGWRLSFIGQTPMACIAILLIALMVPSHAELQRSTKKNSPDKHAESQDAEPKGSKLSRVDFLGATFLTLSILGFLLPLQVAGDRVAWTHPLVLGSLGAGGVFLVLFCVAEQKFAREPIIPLELLMQKDLVMSLIITVAQATAQVGLMIVVPLYFQVTTQASNSEAGAHLVPGVVGNAVGGLVSGSIIKRTGRYKTITVFSLFFACLGYVLLILRWRGNPINAFESTYNFPGGFGVGVMSSSLFVGIQASIDPEHSAVAASTLYLSGLVGCMTGMAGTTAVLLGGLRGVLDRRLDGAGFDAVEKAEIIERAVSDFHYAHRAEGKIAGIVVGSYVEAFTYTHFFALACSLVALISAVFLKEYKM